MACQIRYLSVSSESHWTVQGDQLVECAAKPGSPAVVVLDIADESHAVDTIPMVRNARDGALLARRRLAREFPGVMLTTMLPVRKHKRQAVADVVLIAADTAAKHVATIQAVAGQHCLRGVYTPALLVAEWLRCAAQEQRQVLVVLPTPAGLRLVFVDRCRPLLSRLMPLIDGEAASVEIGRTVQYLHNTQRVSRDVPVEIWFWGMEPSLVAACLPAGDAYRVTTTPAAPRLVDPAQGGFQALMHLVATRPSNDQLAPPALRVGWQARVVRHWAQGLAAAVLVLGFGLAIWFALSAATLRAATASLRQQATHSAAVRAGIEAKLQQQGLSLQQVLDMPEAAAALQEHQVSIREAIDVAGRLFGVRREILLNTVEFHSAPVTGPPAADATCGSDSVAPVASLEAKFILAEGLGVRARAQAIAAVRTALTASQPWRATAEQTALDQRTPLVAKAGSDTATEAVEWTTCLRREGGA
jgi:hypothetical protein